MPELRRRARTSPVLFWLHLFALCALLIVGGIAPPLFGFALLFGGAMTFVPRRRLGETCTLTDLFNSVLMVTCTAARQQDASCGNGYHVLFLAFKWGLDGRGARGSRLVCFYTAAVALAVVGHCFLGVPDHDAAAAADALATPWHWCLYSLTGWYPLAAWAVFKGAPLMFWHFPAQQLDRLTQLYAAVGAAATTGVAAGDGVAAVDGPTTTTWSVLVLVAAMSALNTIVVCHAIWPRVVALAEHTARLVPMLRGTGGVSEQSAAAAAAKRKAE